jgi:outer membrane protein TolC
MWEATLSQPLPKAGERAADRERTAAAVTMAEADYALMAGEITADTAMALAENATARERIAALNTQITRTERVLAAIDTRLATGSGRIAERLALQSNIAAMRLMVAKDERMAEDALADARARLGLPADAPLPSYETPAIPSLDENQSPARRLAAARAAESVAMARMARASARPMTAVGLRFNREEQTMANMDTISFTFMTELPFRSRRYARADERAARADEAAAHAEGAAAGHRLAAAITRVDRAERLATITRRLVEETARRLDAEYESFVRSAGTADGMTGGSTVLMIIDILERHTDAQLQVIDAEGAARLARAELWRYAPAGSFSLNP